MLGIWIQDTDETLTYAGKYLRRYIGTYNIQLYLPLCLPAAAYRPTYLGR